MTAYWSLWLCCLPLVGLVASRFGWFVLGLWVSMFLDFGELRVVWFGCFWVV